jgi:hypothetical protein
MQRQTFILLLIQILRNVTDQDISTRTAGHLSQGSQWPCRDLNSAHPKYKSRALTLCHPFWFVKSYVMDPDEVDFFSWPNPSSHIMALGSTQPLTEMSTGNIPGGKGRPARKADNLTAICEPIVYKIWEPQHLTTLWASTASYMDTFTFYLLCYGSVIQCCYMSVLL